MIQTRGKSQNFAGSNNSTSPSILADGIFTLCSGGTPIQGALQRLPGKTIRDNGEEYGGVISIYQLGQKVVVQRFVGLQIYDMNEINPAEDDFVTDTLLIVVTNNFGLPVTA